MKKHLNSSIIIRSILFWIFLSFSVPFYTLLIPFIFKLPTLIRHKIIVSATFYYQFLLKYIAKITHKITLKEKITTPCIIASNHQSVWETLVFCCIFPYFAWIMKKEVLSIPFFGWATVMASPIAIDRSNGGDALTQIITQGKQRIDSGLNICAFPEGTRMMPGQRRDYKYGIAKLAIALNIPIVPVAHNGGIFIPKKSFWLYPGVVNLVIGKKLYNDDFIVLTNMVQSFINGQLDIMGA